MSEIDRIARLESCIRGVNAWNTGFDWYYSNYDGIYTHRDGSPRVSIYDDVTRLIRLSESLCTRHRSVLSHLRDMNPVKRDDIESDLAISIMKSCDVRLLGSISDDPTEFRQRMYMEFEGSDRYDALVDQEFRSSFHEWYSILEGSYSSFVSQTDEILSKRTNGIVSIIHQSAGLEPRLDISICDWTDERGVDHRAISSLQDRFEDVISLHPMRVSIDSDPHCVYATIERNLSYRENDGHQFDQPRHIRTPEALAGRVLRYVGRYYGADQ